MKTRQYILKFLLLGMLLCSFSSALADEKLSGLQTSLSNTTISGYVSAGVIVDVGGPQVSTDNPPDRFQAFRNWLRNWFARFHSRSGR